MNIDADMFLFLNRALSGSVATPIFCTVTCLGDGLVLAVLLLPTLFVVDRRRFRRHVVPMVIAVALSGLVVNLLKIAVDRPRPEAFFAPMDVDVHTPLGTPPDRAFPSGHTQTAFGAATYLSCLYPKLSPIFLLAAVLVGVSRIAIGVHYPLDVIVGAAFGASFSVTAFWLTRRRARGTPRRQS